MPYIACGIISLRGASILGTVVAERCPPRLFRSFWGTRLDVYDHLFSSGDARPELAAAE